MVDFALSTKEQGIVEKYRDFVDRWIVPNRKKYDESGEFPWEIVKAAYDEGIINGPLPIEYGGNGFSIFETNLASEELGAGCTGIGTTLDANSLALTPTLIAATEEQKKRVYGEIIEKKGVAAYCLTEPEAGSDVQGIKSTAILKGDKYILNGEKRFITNGQEACYLTVFAQVNPDKGARSLTGFLVPGDAPGITMVSKLDKMGQRASVQNQILFEDVEIPIDNRLGKEGSGFVLAMRTFDKTRTGIAAQSVGNARAAFEISRDWAKNRIQFGKPISSNQAIAFMLADMATSIENARLITWKAAWAVDAGTKDASRLSAMSKLYASDIAMDVTTDAVQIMGGEGYSKEYPVEKMMRDAKLDQIFEGTNQIQRLVISKSVLKGR